MITTRRAFALAVLAAACGRQQATPALQQFGGPTMGSTYLVKYFGDQPAGQVRDEVQQLLMAFDAAFSRWRDDSEISRLNAHASTEPFVVSPLFADVLADALRIAAATDGAFDPTIAPLTELYRRARKAGGGLEAAALDAARSRVDFRAVAVRDGAVVKARPDVQLDLDGIVAGACADAIAARLAELGITDLYLDVTGEILCRGSKPDADPWRIGVVDPGAVAEGREQPLRQLPLRDAALCTSGDYRNTIVVDGEVVHHVFDPRTGRNPPHRVVSASVLARSAALADALGTALLVLGDDDARTRWPSLRAMGAEAVLLLRVDGDGALEQIELDWPAAR